MPYLHKTIVFVSIQIENTITNHKNPTLSHKIAPKPPHLPGRSFLLFSGPGRSFCPDTCVLGRTFFPKKCDPAVEMKEGLFLGFWALKWTSNPSKWKRKVRPSTSNWRISIPTVGLSATFTARFRAFSPLHIHHSNNSKWVILEGKLPY